VFDQIEKLKHELTDKYVVVHEDIPELARFDGHVGQVKTVNMNGRALVEFDAWNNIGWYDIDVDCLKVVPKPEAGAADAKKQEAPKAATKAPAKPAAAAGEKKLSPLEMARMQGAARPGGAAPAAAKPAAAKPATEKPAAAKPAAGKQSTADILAAARAAKAGAPAAEKPAAAEPAVEPVVAAPAPKAKPATAGPTLTPGQRLSVSEILVWCRQHDAK